MGVQEACSIAGVLAKGRRIGRAPSECGERSRAPIDGSDQAVDRDGAQSFIDKVVIGDVVAETKPMYPSHLCPPGQHGNLGGRG